jgi:hypothetical protein
MGISDTAECCIIEGRIMGTVLYFNLLKSSGNLRTTMFNIEKFSMMFTLRFCVLYGSQNKHGILRYKILGDWFL